MGESKLSFFVVDIILLIVFLGLVKTIFSLGGLAFLMELLFVSVLIIIAFIALIPSYSGSRGGWGFLSAVFLLILADLLIIYAFTQRAGTIFLGTLFFTALGFLISAMKIKRKEHHYHAEPEQKAAEVEKEVYTNFEPGKFVASKTGTTYHIPKCDWAAKIKKKNQIWFDDEKEARKRFSPHNCVK